MLAIHDDKPPMLHNQYFIKQVGDKITVTRFNSVFASGWECDAKRKEIKRDVNTYKLKRHLQRAKNKIFEYAYCNEWQYFFTGTLDAKKHSRDDLDSFEKNLSQFIRDQRKKTGCNIQYLLVPELHSDLTSWHCHGLISGLPDTAISINDNGYPVWTDYNNKFGFCSLDSIKSHIAVSKYLTKYVTKNFWTCNDGEDKKSRGVVKKEKNLYLVSRGLKSAVSLYQGPLPDFPFSPSYSNDFCDIYEFDSKSKDIILNYIPDKYK